MKPAENSPARHRLAGLAIALFGVALNRLAAPLCPEAWRDFIVLSGQLLVVASLLVMARGVRLRIQNSPTSSAAPDATTASPAPR
ncbi:MAG: hypothetical protein H7067_14045 [Burkholderiales bacterium]|nr:hypothetical protein [Opitutaceae bacterium]